MKVLVVEIKEVSLSESAEYRIALQGKVFSDVAENSDKPQFKESVLRVPFAVVRNGQEVLVGTVHRRLIGKNGEEEFQRVGQGAVPLKSPGKDEKLCVIDIKEGTESSIINGTISVSYKLIRITMRESLRGGSAPIGLNAHGGFYDTKPVEAELHLLDGDNLIGTGKMTVKK